MGKMDKSTISCVVCRKLVRKPTAIFKFPADATRRQLWVEGVRNVRPEWTPVAKSYSLCESHFSASWVERCTDPTSRKRTVLRPGAFPDLLFKDKQFPVTSTVELPKLKNNNSNNNLQNISRPSGSKVPQMPPLVAVKQEIEYADTDEEEVEYDESEADLDLWADEIGESSALVETVDDEIDETSFPGMELQNPFNGNDDTDMESYDDELDDETTSGTRGQKNIAFLSDEEREYIIDMIFNQGKQVSQLSKELGCTKEAIYGVTRAFRDNSRPRHKGRDNNNRSSSSSSVPTEPTIPILNKYFNQQEEEALLHDYLKSRNCTTIKQLEDYIASNPEMFPSIRSVSKRTLYRILKRSRDLLESMPALDSETEASVLQERLKYVQEMSRLEKANPAKIVFVDVCGYEVKATKQSCRDLVGSRLTVEKANVRGGKLSFCMALSERGIQHSTFRLKLLTIDIFLRFLRELAQKLPKGRHIFVLEDVPFNRDPSLQSYFKGSGNLVRYLPQYSPFLNPLREGFAAVREKVSLKATNRRNILSALKTAKNSITIDESFSWIANARFYYEKCLNRESIVHAILTE